MGFLVIFIQKAIGQGIGILYGALGEIMTEKSGNLNLGIPGMMYMGGIAGLIGAFLYENGTANPSGLAGLLISFVCAFVCAALGGLVYSVLTITLRANQNVTGLALTTFGVGFGNFFGGSLAKLAGGVGQISVAVTGAVFDTMAVGTAVRDFLVGFQKRLLVVGMHLRTPDGRRVGNDAAGQVKLVHHGLGITKNAGFHVADVDIVVGTLHQSVQQINRIIGEVHAGAALWGMQQRVLGVGDVETPLFFVELFIHVA